MTGQNGRILTAKNAWGYDMPTHYQTLVDAVPGSTLTLTSATNVTEVSVYERSTIPNSVKEGAAVMKSTRSAVRLAL